MGVPSKRANLRTQNLMLSLALIPSEAVISKKIKKSNKRRRKNANGMFECKTCSREFPSFQALGGHSTSHLRPKVRFTGIDLDIGEKYNKEPIATRHVCGFCDKEFSTGPALGGHMRLHRDRTLLPVMSSAAVQRSLDPEDDFGLNLFEQIGSDYQELRFDGVVVSVHDHDHEGSPGRLLNLFE